MTVVDRRYLLTAGAILLALIGFGESLLNLITRWNEQEEYSHGYLIVAVAICLLWLRRDALRRNIGQPSWSGPFLVLLALCLHIVGQLSSILILSQVGFVIAIIGIILGTGGYELLKTAIFPIAFLLFAIPLPYFIDAKLTLQLQLVSSELGVFFIRLIGLPVYLDGNIIDLGNYRLQVVEACSGLRYLYPLLSLSFLAAYLFRAPIWQRAVIFLSAIPIAVGMNGLRIGLVGILVDRYGTAMADGMLHLFEGWMIFIACSILLIAEMYLLALFSGKALSERITILKMPIVIPYLSDAKPIIQRPLLICLALLCAGSILVFKVSGREESIQPRSRFVEFPAQLARWQGHPQLLDAETEKKLGFDDYILSDFTEAVGDTVNLYVAYYDSQRKAESPHSPIVCMPGGGWIITKIQQIEYDDSGHAQPLNRLVIEKGSAKQLVYYWFNERGRIITNEYWAKIYLLVDAIVMNRTDGALVRLVTPIRANESEEEGDVRLQSFMKTALPSLAKFLPGRSAPSVSSASLERSDQHL
jgi:exosortase D (VPLPA-CTERM-specific)